MGNENTMRAVKIFGLRLSKAVEGTKTPVRKEKSHVKQTILHRLDLSTHH